MQRIAPKDLAKLIGVALAAPHRVGLDLIDDRYELFLRQLTEATARFIGAGAVVHVACRKARIGRPEDWHVVVDPEVVDDRFASIHWGDLDENTERYQDFKAHLVRVLMEDVTS